ncbi:Transforming growth factor-beta receptor type I [Phytophthora megakarya]|uniref:Transforming growth factor-beta receptor type I n=1 Tax=Phytophthora megakarya TaxID=4795 RepID=A0A225V777_9STRA|nr:Transforming growth factor-beta receptor type I [Phytophthora megakarya]
MAEIRKHVSSFRKIVAYFNKSAEGKDKLKELQQAPVPLTVIADVAMRWNSTHQMLRRLLGLRPVLQEFFVYVQMTTGKEEFSDLKLARPTAGANVVDFDPNSSVEMGSDDDDDFEQELLECGRDTPVLEAAEDLSLRETVKTELKV